MKNLRITLWVFMALEPVAAAVCAIMYKTDLFSYRLWYFSVVMGVFILPVLGLFGLILTGALILAQKREGLAVKTGDKILFALYVLCLLSPFIVIRLL